MNRNALTTIIAVVAAFTIGFGWSMYNAGNTSGVAVVDLDEVARQLGRDQEMVSSIKTQAGALNQQLVNAQQSALKQLEEIKAGLGAEPSAEDAKKFVLAQRSAQLQLNQIRQQAEGQVGQHRQQLVKKFRDEAKPIAKKVADQRGMKTVITANDSLVFSFDDTVDITDEVIALMSAEAPAKTAKPAAKQPTPAPKTATQTAAQPAPTTTN